MELGQTRKLRMFSSSSSSPSSSGMTDACAKKVLRTWRGTSQFSGKVDLRGMKACVSVHSRTAVAVAQPLAMGRSPGIVMSMFKCNSKQHLVIRR
jgi:hypothetical protein